MATRVPYVSTRGGSVALLSDAIEERSLTVALNLSTILPESFYLTYHPHVFYIRGADTVQSCLIFWLPSFLPTWATPLLSSSRAGYRGYNVRSQHEPRTVMRWMPLIVCFMCHSMASTVASLNFSTILPESFYLTHHFTSFIVRGVGAAESCPIYWLPGILPT
jgi:hypothetical protein